MTEKRKILKAGTAYFLGNIFDKAVAFLTVPIFTRLLSTSDYGVTATYQSWVSILSVIITLSLGNSIRTAVVDYKNKIGAYMSSIFALGTCSALVISFFICFFSSFFYSKDVLIMVCLCCLNAYSTSIISAVQWRYIMELNYLKRTLLQCIPNLIAIVFSIIMIKQLTESKYLGRIVPIAVVFSFFGIGYLLYYFCKEKTFYNKIYWSYACSFSLPIIFHSLSTVILSQFDRTMITWLRNSSETGIYGLAYQFGMVPLVVTTTFENIWIPWFTKKMEEGNKKIINKMVIYYIRIVTIMCIGIMCIAPEVLKFMSTPEYYNAIYIIPPIIVSTFLMFLASISLDLEYYLKKTRTIASNTVIAALVNVILNLIFIPMYGAIAAAYTTVVAYLVSFLMHYFVARKMDKNLFDFKIYFGPLIIIGCCTVIVTLLINYVFARWVLGVVFGLVFIIQIKKFNINMKK